MGALMPGPSQHAAPPAPNSAPQPSHPTTSVSGVVSAPVQPYPVATPAVSVSAPAVSAAVVSIPVQQQAVSTPVLAAPTHSQGQSVAPPDTHPTMASSPVPGPSTQPPETSVPLPANPVDPQIQVPLNIIASQTSPSMSEAAAGEITPVSKVEDPHTQTATATTFQSQPNQSSNLATQILQPASHTMASAETTPTEQILSADVQTSQNVAGHAPVQPEVQDIRMEPAPITPAEELSTREENQQIQSEGIPSEMSSTPQIPVRPR